MKDHGFEKFSEDFRSILENERIKLGETTGNKVLLPEGFDDVLLQKYIAYRNVVQTKRLVIATWVLATATIILNILILIQ